MPNFEKIRCMRMRRKMKYTEIFIDIMDFALYFHIMAAAAGSGAVGSWLATFEFCLDDV